MVDNKLPNDTVSYLSSKDTECSWSHPWWNYCLEAGMARKGLKKKTLNYTWKIICVCWMIILNWILKKIVFYLKLFLHYNNGKV